VATFVPATARAPGRARVWGALSDAEEFGTWFGADVKGASFAPCRWARRKITNPGTNT
jgi:hypothetical protein